MTLNFDIFGYLATALNLLMLIPQVISTWRKKQAKDLSLATILLFLTACFLWLYGIAKAAPPVILANTVGMIMNLILAILKLKYG